MAAVFTGKATVEIHPVSGGVQVYVRDAEKRETIVRLTPNETLRLIEELKGSLSCQRTAFDPLWCGTHGAEFGDGSAVCEDLK